MTDVQRGTKPTRKKAFFHFGCTRSFSLAQLEKGGILEKMQNSLAASISTAVFAFPKAKEARALEAATQPPRIPVTPATTSEPEAPATPATTVAPAATAATDAAAGSVPAKSEEEAAPLVESGGIFSAFAAVDAHCNEITKKFTEKLSSMRRVNPQRQRQRQPRHQLKPYRPLPAYARGQQIPLFPYRNTAPPPPSLLQLRDRRCRLQQHAERKGAWEVREELPHVNASFPDAAWFSLGCCAGRTWRRLLLQSEVTAAQQLQLLRMLQGDDLVEGCFVIDTIHNDHTVRHSPTCRSALPPGLQRQRFRTIELRIWGLGLTDKAMKGPSPFHCRCDTS